MPGPRAINNPAISYFWGSELSRAVTRHFWRMQRDLGFKAKHDGMRQIIATHFVNDLTNPLHITSLAVVSRVWNHVIIALLDSAGLHLCKFSARYENVSFYLSRLCKLYLVLKVSLTTFSTTFRPFFKKTGDAASCLVGGTLWAHQWPPPPSTPSPSATPSSFQSLLDQAQYVFALEDA